MFCPQWERRNTETRPRTTNDHDDEYSARLLRLCKGITSAPGSLSKRFHRPAPPRAFALA